MYDGDEDDDDLFVTMMMMFLLSFYRILDMAAHRRKPFQTEMLVENRVFLSCPMSLRYINFVPFMYMSVVSYMRLLSLYLFLPILGLFTQ